MSQYIGNDKNGMVEVCTTQRASQDTLLAVDPTDPTRAAFRKATGAEMSTAFALPGTLKTAGGASIVALQNSAPFSFVLDGATTNYVPNPSFEVDTSYWESVGGASIARDATQVVFGSYSCRLDFTAVAAEQGMRTVLGAIASAGSVQWVVSAYVRLQDIISNKNVRLRIEYYDASGAVLRTDTSASFSIPAGIILGLETTVGWARITFVSSGGLAPASTTNVRVLVLNDGTNQGAFSLWVDCIQAELTAALGAGISAASSYCDGGIGPGYGWMGAAHQSPSFRLAGDHLLSPFKVSGSSFRIDTNGTVRVNSGWTAGSQNPQGILVFQSEDDSLQGTCIDSTGVAAVGKLGAAADLSLRGQGSGAVLVAGLRVTGSGGSFPTTPTTNDCFFRTDHHLLYFYDGTRWLSTEKYALSMSPYIQLPSVAISANQTSTFLLVLPEYASGQIWVEEYAVSLSPAAPEDATNHWQLDIYNADFAASLGALVTTGMIGEQRQVKTCGVAIPINNTKRYFITSLVKNAAPGNITLEAITITYRVLAT